MREKLREDDVHIRCNSAKLGRTYSDLGPRLPQN